MKKLYIILLVACSLMTTLGFAQVAYVKSKQVVFVNGGYFMNALGNVQVYDPTMNMTSELAQFDVATSVQDLVSEGRYIWVSADYNIIKYNLITQSEETRKYTQDTDPNDDDGGGIEGNGVNHSMALYKDWLIVTRQFSTDAPDDGFNVRIYDKNDLSLVRKIQISNQAGGVITVGDSAFVAINGGWQGNTGKLAIIDLKNLQLKEEYNFGTDGTSIMQLFHKDGTIYALADGKILNYNIKGHTHALHPVGLGHSDASSSPLASTLIGNTLYAKTRWEEAGQTYKGFGTIDLTTFTITNKDLVGMHTDKEIQDRGDMLMAAAYDTLDKRFYITYGYWLGDGVGRIYNLDGTPAGSFDHVHDSPERMVVSYEVTTHIPEVARAFPQGVLYDNESYTIDFSPYFKDADGEPLTYYVNMADGADLPGWMTVNGSTLTATPGDIDADERWEIRVIASDTYNMTTSQNLVLKTGKTSPLNQVLFVNGGYFMNALGNVQVYDPSINTTAELAEFDVASSVQDVVSEGKDVWVSADYNIIKYDLVTKTEVTRKYTQDTNPNDDDGGGTEGNGVNHSMALYKDWLITTRQFSSGTPDDGYNVRIYNKSNLSLVRKIQVSNQAGGVITVGDSAFVAINGGWQGNTGKLAIIDLKNLQLKEEYNFGTDGTSIMQLFHKDGTIYALADGKILNYNIKGHTHALHPVGLGHSDASSSPLASTLIGNTLYAKTRWEEAGQTYKGFGTIDLTTFTITNKDLVGMHTDKEIQDAGHMLMAAAYDTLAKRFYITYGYWLGDGVGRIYNLDGTPAGSFNNVHDSPERMSICYGTSAKLNHDPYATALLEDINVFEKESSSVDVSTVFKDADGDAINYSATLADGSPLPAWITINNSTLSVIDAPKDQAINATVKITATDTWGANLSQNVVIHVTPIDDAPIVVAPLADRTVDQDSQNQTISLNGVFTDEDNDAAGMTYTIAGNTNAALVNPVISGSDMSLSFAAGQHGEATITLQVLSGEKTATTAFKVIVKEKVVTGVAEETIAVSVYPNPVHNQVNIDFGNSYYTATLSLLTTTGNILVSRAATSANDVLDMRALPAGIYILVIRTPQGEVKKKLLKN